MAFKGFGIYALVFNSLILASLNTISFSIFMKWLPSFRFSISRLSKMLRYSYKLLLSNLIEVIYTNIFPIVIGKSFSIQSLGFYNNGRQIPSLLSSSINASITSVTFSVYSRYQTDLDKLKSLTRDTVIVTNFIMLPLMAFLAAIAEPLVVLILTEKWLPSVPYLQLFCLIYGLHHQHNISFQAIAATGRSDLFLRYQFIKKIFGICFLALMIKFNLIYVVIGQIFTTFLSIIITATPNKNILNYSVNEQLTDFIPYLLISLIMFYGLIYVGKVDIPILGLLTIQAFVAILIYIGLSAVLQLRGLSLFKNILNSFFKKK